MSHTTFAALGCAEPFLAAIDKRGFTSPTTVQAECFAAGIEGRDLLVQSRTGSGKTLAFGLPLMHRLKDGRHPQALILAPTRELAQQVAQEFQSVMPRLSIAELVGGLSYVPQLKALKFGAPVVVGTPGRVMDHLDKGTLDLSKVSMVVLDECDEMLNMGFIEDVEKILSAVPDHPQTYLFSATLPAPIASLARRFLQNPFKVSSCDAGGTSQHADIAHTPCLVAEHLQTKALANLLLMDEPSGALIFTKTKQQTEVVAEALRSAGLAADYLHGDLAQGARNRIMSNFKEGKLRYLVATDVAARGIDIEAMPLVVHIGIPHSLESYIHRSGRTGRAGAKGASLALVGFKESRILLAWARKGGLKLEWRAIPGQAEIREARAQRLAARIMARTSPERTTLATQLLAKRNPIELVAALLSMVEGEESAGFHIPDAPRSEYRSEKPAFKSKPTEKTKKDAWERKVPYHLAKDQPPSPRKTEDKAYGPRKTEDKSYAPRKTNDKAYRPGKPFNHPNKPSSPHAAKPYAKRRKGE